MTSYHVIPDIHGHADKLNGLLSHLGWQQSTAGWRAPDPNRRLLFLGDFIDRGPDNAAVLHMVRSLIDSGKADAVMGNHEFNAIHYHTTRDGDQVTTASTDRALRDHSAKNERQHASFLAEFPVGDPATRDWIEWMLTLPLFFETPQLRAVHACWHQPSIDTIAQALPQHRLSRENLATPGWTKGDLWDALQIATSGVEVALPGGHAFKDKAGDQRHHVRLAWWLDGADTWSEIARSVPDPTQLPDTQLPPEVASFQYTDTKPVFFGHYQLTGAPFVDADYALCLDYSAGSDWALIAYDFEAADQKMRADRIVPNRPDGVSLSKEALP